MENLQGGTLSLEHRYTVTSREDRVGFVSRYRGEQLPFQRPVWITVYDRLAEAGAESSVFDRIEQSAHDAHGIDEQGALRLLDYGELDKGLPFIVSDRVEGPTLADHLDENGPLPPSDVTKLVDRLAALFESLHERGKTHGTLSKQWIFLRDANPADPRVDHFQVGLTLDELRRMDGAVLTPEIVRAFPPETFERDTIPPEELDDDHDPTTEFTPAADIFALGVVAYESLVGFHPFFDDNDDPSDASDGIVRLQKGEARPLADFGIEEGLSDVVARAIAREPSERWDSASGFADALRRAHPGPSETDDSEDVRDLAEPQAEPDEPSEPQSFDAEQGALEPGGPASLLVTLVIAALLASNLGWFLYMMDSRASAQQKETSPDRLTSEKNEADRHLELQSRPPGATVFAKGREKPIGKTPVRLPPSLFDASPVELEVKKAGFRNQTLRLDRNAATRTFTVELRETTAQ